MPASAPLRVLVAGCGLVVELHHLPALARSAATSRSSASSIRARRDGRPASPRPRRDVRRPRRGARRAGPEEVVVASPAALHRDQTLAALAAGAHVLCEKPMAMTGADCSDMIDAAEAAGRVLGVGLMRRFHPSVRAIASIIAERVLGPPVSFTVLEGVSFSWPVRSAHPFERGRGGGVLFDAGPHTVDLLQLWFGELALVDYVDDAMGGVEASCTAHAGGARRGRRDRPHEPGRAAAEPPRHPLRAGLGGVPLRRGRPLLLGLARLPHRQLRDAQRRVADRPLWDFPDVRRRVPRLTAAFVAQHRNMIEAIRGTAELVVTARSRPPPASPCSNGATPRAGLMPMPVAGPAGRAVERAAVG